MNVRQAKEILHKIFLDSSIADQFTEEEIEELEKIVKNAKCLDGK